MRTWFALGCALTLSAGLVGACGSTTSSTATDAGVADAVAAETGPAIVDASKDVHDAALDSAKCDLSADFTTTIPDAPLDDSGTHTTGQCLACVKKPENCKASVDQCNANCECKAIINDVLTCVTKGGQPLTCAAGAAGASFDALTIGKGLLDCMQKKCPSDCSSTLVDASAFQDAATD